MSDKRVYMVTGQDEHGDVHIFSTESLRRAEAMLSMFNQDMRNVTGNWITLGDQEDQFKASMLKH